MRHLLASVVIAAVTLASASAIAQVNNQAAAEALFSEGRRLMKAKKYAEAAEKFAASDRADPSVGARINLGDCYQAMNKTASAWSSYKSAANLARQKQDSRRAVLASKKANDLAPKLTFLVIEVDGQVSGQSIKIDGKEIAEALWGQRIPVDPGTLEVTSEAPGHQAFSTQIDTGAPGAAITIKVALTSTATTPRPEPEPEPDTEPRPDSRITTPAPPADDPGSGRRYLGLGVGAGGLVAVGVGLGFGASARSKWNAAFEGADPLCDESTNVCSPEGQEQTDTARTHATISTVAVIAGAAMIGAGAFLYLTAPDGGGEERNARLAPVIGPEQVGLGISGAF